MTIDLYVAAARIVRNVLDKSISVKAAVFSPNIEHRINKKALYALVSETLRYRDFLQDLLQRTALLKHEKALANDEVLAMVLLYEHVLGKGIIGRIKECFRHHKQAIHAQCEMMKVKAGVTDVHDLLPESYRRTAQVQLPKYVRVNHIRKKVWEVVAAFAKDGYKEVPCELEDDCSEDSFRELVSSLKPGQFILDPNMLSLLVFPPSTDLHRNALYSAGDIILQDKASCYPAWALFPPPGSSVIDCCAAPGNKTSLLADLICNRGVIYAFDKDPKRLSTLKTQMKKAGATCVQAECRDFLSIDPHDPKYDDVEYILVDPSCSGSGMVAHYRTTGLEESVPQSRLEQLSKFQITILKHALSFPKVKKVVYSTCSVYEEENENVVEEVLSQVDEQFELKNLDPDWHNRGIGEKRCAKYCLRMSPDRNLTNGFFVSCFVKKEDLSHLERCGMKVGQKENGEGATVTKRKHCNSGNEQIEKRLKVIDTETEKHTDLVATTVVDSLASKLTVKSSRPGWTVTLVEQ